VRAIECAYCGAPRKAAVHSACPDHKRYRTAVLRYGTRLKADRAAAYKGPPDCRHASSEHHDYATPAQRAAREDLARRIVREVVAEGRAEGWFK